MKWQADRSEEFLSASHGRDVTSRAELALDADGKALALRVRSLRQRRRLRDAGRRRHPAADRAVGLDQHLRHPRRSTCTCTAVLTNTTPTGAYRGAGRPEAIYIIERLIDAAAREMRLDPAELRRRNMIRPEQMPYTNPMGQTYDSGAFEKILDQGLALADWNGFAARRAESEARGKLRGRGIATFLEWTGGNALRGEGQRRRHRPTASSRSSRRRRRWARASRPATRSSRSTSSACRSRRSASSRATPTAATASAAPARARSSPAARRCSVASEQTVDHGEGRSPAEALEAAAGDIEYRAGALRRRRHRPRHRPVRARRQAAGAAHPSRRDQRRVGGADLAERVPRLRGRDRSRDRRRRSRRLRVGQRHRPRRQPDDRRAARSTAARCRASARRSCEQVVYDREQRPARSPAASWTTRVPRADIGRGFRTEFDTSMPCTTNPLGVKGVGELGTIGATPAAMNAVVDALDHAGLGRAAETIGDAGDARARLADAALGPSWPGSRRLTQPGSGTNDGNASGWRGAGRGALDDAAREQVGVAVVADLDDLGRRRRRALERGLGGRRIFALAVAGAELLLVARAGSERDAARGLLGRSGGVGRRRTPTAPGARPPCGCSRRLPWRRPAAPAGTSCPASPAPARETPPRRSRRRCRGGRFAPRTNRAGR